MNTPTIQPSTTPARQIGAGGLLARLGVFVLLVSTPFLAAGTLNWPQGLLYLSMIVFLTGGSRMLMARKYPDLVQERLHAADRPNSKQWDRPLSAIMGLWGTLVVWIVAGLNVRFAWPPSIPIGWQILGAIVFVLSTLFGTWAMLENRFFSALVRIQTDRGHTVVTTGPYRFVRHPGYVAGILGYLALPLLLNSLWAFIPAVLTIVLIVVRTRLEDATLQAELPGYREYTRQTRYRLLPGVW